MRLCCEIKEVANFSQIVERSRHIHYAFTMAMRIAYWVSEKKSQKINWTEFESVCRRYGFELFKLDLGKSLKSQEPFAVFLHKLTDVIVSGDQGDTRDREIIRSIETYIARSDRLIVIDPIENVRRLLNRFKCYDMIRGSDLHLHGIFMPSFCEIRSSSPEKVAQVLRDAGISYPFICKPHLGHGSKEAHRMLLIFNENGLDELNVPCVAQTFVNHNAVLYKLFVVGDEYCFVERPSLRNFYASDAKSIAFESSAVSKAGANSDLNILDPDDEAVSPVIPDRDVLDRIARTLPKIFGMDLIGVDVVVENGSGHYAIIDVNAFPGYDGFPNFYETVLRCIRRKLDAASTTEQNKSNMIL